MTDPSSKVIHGWTGRNPRAYFGILDSVEAQEDDGRWAHFELQSCKCVDTYVRLKRNQNQVRGLQ